MTKLSVVVITFALISASTCSEWCSRSKSVGKNAPPTCCVAVGDLASGRLVNGTTPRVEKDLLPSWVNLTLAKIGQKWALKHREQIVGGHVFGLIFILAFSEAHTLQFTNQSDTPDRAAKRYAKTIAEINIWYEQDLDVGTNEDSVTKSLLRVRALHNAANIAGNKRIFKEKTPLVNPDLYKGVLVDEGMWSAFNRDLEMSNIPANKRILPKSYNPKEGSWYAQSQFAMSVTQYAFVGFPVQFPDRLFIIDATEEDRMAYNHLWAVLGYALGIDDEYNLALQPNLERAMEYYQMFFDDWLTPVFFDCDFNCKLMVEAMLKGLAKLVDVFTPRNLLIRLLEDILKIPAPYMRFGRSPDDITKELKFYATGMNSLFANMTVY